jgi:hypothetical protein
VTTLATCAVQPPSHTPRGSSYQRAFLAPVTREVEMIVGGMLLSKGRTYYDELTAMMREIEGVEIAAEPCARSRTVTARMFAA